MPSPPAQPTTLSVGRFTVETVTDSVHCQNVFDFVSTINAPISQGDLLGAITQFRANFLVAFKGVVSPKTSFFSWSAAEIHYGVTPTQIILDVATTVGTAGATSNPLEMAATIVKTSTLKGKHGRGRISMPAVPDTFITPATSPNQLNATGLAAYNALASALLAGFVGGSTTWTPCITTRPTPPATLVSNLVTVTGMATKALLGTARRRKPGRGI